ncbi:hypothetical protein BVRB_5g119720 [Beta vulgaris subsp. vulgaris]|nr:hypothetical protein BVRB_5g119720 [Beta vulgaris subsp. vulgaris]
MDLKRNEGDGSVSVVKESEKPVEESTSNRKSSLSNVTDVGNLSDKNMMFRADMIDFKSWDVQLEKHSSRVWSRDCDLNAVKEEWEIELAKLDLNNVIAHGTYGSVYRATYDGKDVAASSSKKKPKDGDEDEDEDGSKKKKLKRKKNPNAPRRAMSGFIFFSQAERENTKKDNPGITFLDIGKVLGERWRNMSAEEKEPYEAKALADKKRYLAALDDYKNALAAISYSGDESDSP